MSVLAGDKGPEPRLGMSFIVPESIVVGSVLSPEMAVSNRFYILRYNVNALAPFMF